MRKFKFLVLASLTFMASSCNNASSKKATSEEQQASAITVQVNPDPAHNSKISLDWAGTYEGVLPCADCEGIKTSITLNSDHTFSKSEIYLKGEKESKFETKGQFEWDESGGIVILENEDEKHSYRVGENILIHLDINGNAITGSLAEHYILKKK